MINSLVNIYSIVISKLYTIAATYRLSFIFPNKGTTLYTNFSSRLEVRGFITNRDTINTISGSLEHDIRYDFRENLGDFGSMNTV